MQTLETNRTGYADPARILGISWGLARTGALVAALDLDLFTLIDRGVNRADTIAAHQGISLRGVEALLLGVAALGLIARQPDGSWALSKDSAAFLVRGRAAYLGDMRHVFHKLNFRIWPELSRSVQSGASPKDLFDEQDTDWTPVLQYLDTLGQPAAEGIAHLLAERVGAEAKVLDIGCGAGIYGHTIARRLPASHVVGIDREDNTRNAAARARAAGIDARVEYRVGELREVAWGGPYDAVLMSHLLHGYAADTIRAFLRLAHAALRPGGYVIINEFVPDLDEPTRTPMQALFGLQMLLTSSGAAYGAADYSAWLGANGFDNIELIAAPAGPSSYIVAQRSVAAREPRS
jgi:2-polyprenyl-3-methyl-5-hydroxy-6-metoxy-1,4-benzoquinol methylase